MRLTTVAFALFASLAMAAPSPAGEVGAAAAELDARDRCGAGCLCDGGICRCTSVCASVSSAIVSIDQDRRYLPPRLVNTNTVRSAMTWVATGMTVASAKFKHFDV